MRLADGLSRSCRMLLIALRPLGFCAAHLAIVFVLVNVSGE
jgi:hypothetical protein